MARREDQVTGRADRRLQHFDDAFRRWADRPSPPPPAWPAGHPARSARRHVLPRWQLAAVALVLVVALGVGVLLRTASVPESGPTAAEPAPTAVAALASPDEVLILWLDPETPLYLTLPTVDAAVENERSAR